MQTIIAEEDTNEIAAILIYYMLLMKNVFKDTCNRDLIMCVADMNTIIIQGEGCFLLLVCMLEEKKQQLGLRSLSVFSSSPMVLGHINTQLRKNSCIHFVCLFQTDPSFPHLQQIYQTCII